MKRRRLAAGAVVVVAIGGLIFWVIALQHHQMVLQYMAGTMTFEVVTTPVQQERGLGGRNIIPDNYGMLFVFSKPDRYGFWMKDMLAPIDIIWLSKDGHIVAIDGSVSPNTYPKAFYPPEVVPYVLETRAGYTHEHGWAVGTLVPLPPPYGT